VFELPLQQIDLLPEGYLLKAYLIRHRISQTWLAHQLGIGNNTISRYMQNVSFHSRTLDDILKALGADYEEVFGQGAHKLPVAPTQAVDESPIGDHTQQETSLLMARRQLCEWQAHRDRLQARGASEQELSFCQYQIWHLELSLPTLGLSNAVNLSNSTTP
jgi:transcriptional regulator with XRE-family HTH domain